MRTPRRLLATTALFAVGLTAAAAPQTESEADSTSPEPARPVRRATVTHLDLADLVRRADLVFHGDVVDIRYATSAPAGPGREALPHTFVTYAVRSVLSGTAPGSTVTLRFVGGYDPERGLYLHASCAPRFDLGDSDVLFVQGNGTSLSPLVGQDSGRLRVIGGRLYTETGRAVTLDADGKLAIGARHLFEEVLTTYLPTGVERIEVGPDALPGPGEADPVDELVARVAALPVPARGPAPATAFVDADPSVPFAGPDLRAVAPPSAGPAPRPLTRRELLERASEQEPDRSLERRNR